MCVSASNACRIHLRMVPSGSLHCLKGVRTKYKCSYQCCVWRGIRFYNFLSTFLSMDSGCFINSYPVLSPGLLFLCSGCRRQHDIQRAWHLQSEGLRSDSVVSLLPDLRGLWELTPQSFRSPGTVLVLLQFPEHCDHSCPPRGPSLLSVNGSSFLKATSSFLKRSDYCHQQCSQYLQTRRILAVSGQEWTRRR